MVVYYFTIEDTTDLYLEKDNLLGECVEYLYLLNKQICFSKTFYTLNVLHVQKCL